MANTKYFHGYKIAPGNRRLVVWTFDSKTHTRISTHTTIPNHVSKAERGEVVALRLREFGIALPKPTKQRAAS